MRNCDSNDHRVFFQGCFLHVFHIGQHAVDLNERQPAVARYVDLEHAMGQIIAFAKQKLHVPRSPSSNRLHASCNLGWCLETC